MKNCEAVVGVIHEVKGHKISLGPIKLLPILGSEIPVERQGFKTQIGLTADCDGESGFFAEMVDPKTVAVFRYFREVIKEDKPICYLVGHQINKAPLTRKHLRWVKVKAPSSYIEAAQQPDSTF